MTFSLANSRSLWHDRLSWSIILFPGKIQVLLVWQAIMISYLSLENSWANYQSILAWQAVMGNNPFPWQAPRSFWHDKLSWSVTFSLANSRSFWHENYHGQWLFPGQTSCPFAWQAIMVSYHFPGELQVFLAWQAIMVNNPFPWQTPGPFGKLLGKLSGPFDMTSYYWPMVSFGMRSYSIWPNKDHLCWIFL